MRRVHIEKPTEQEKMYRVRVINTVGIGMIV